MADFRDSARLESRKLFRGISGEVDDDFETPPVRERPAEWRSDPQQQHIPKEPTPTTSTGTKETEKQIEVTFKSETKADQDPNAIQGSFAAAAAKETQTKIGETLDSGTNFAAAAPAATESPQTHHNPWATQGSSDAAAAAAALSAKRKALEPQETFELSEEEPEESPVKKRPSALRTFKKPATTAAASSEVLEPVLPDKSKQKGNTMKRPAASKNLPGQFCDSDWEWTDLDPTPEGLPRREGVCGDWKVREFVRGTGNLQGTKWRLYEHKGVTHKSLAEARRAGFKGKREPEDID